MKLVISLAENCTFMITANKQLLYVESCPISEGFSRISCLSSNFSITEVIFAVKTYIDTTLHDNCESIQSFQYSTENKYSLITKDDIKSICNFTKLLGLEEFKLIDYLSLYANTQSTDGLIIDTYFDKVIASYVLAGSVVDSCVYSVTSFIEKITDIMRTYQITSKYYFGFGDDLQLDVTNYIKNYEYISDKELKLLEPLLIASEYANRVLVADKLLSAFIKEEDERHKLQEQPTESNKKQNNSSKFSLRKDNKVRENTKVEQKSKENTKVEQKSKENKVEKSQSNKLTWIAVAFLLFALVMFILSLVYGDKVTEMMNKSSLNINQNTLAYFIHYYEML